MVDGLAETDQDVEYVGAVVEEGAALDVGVERGLGLRVQGLVEVLFALPRRVRCSSRTQTRRGGSWMWSARVVLVLRSMDRSRTSCLSLSMARLPSSTKPHCLMGLSMCLLKWQLWVMALWLQSSQRPLVNRSWRDLQMQPRRRKRGREYSSDTRFCMDGWMCTMVLMTALSFMHILARREHGGCTLPSD